MVSVWYIATLQIARSNIFETALPSLTFEKSSVNEQQQLRGSIAQRAAGARRLRLILCVVLAGSFLVGAVVFAIAALGHKTTVLIASTASALPGAHLEDAPIVNHELIDTDMGKAPGFMSPNDALAFAATRREAQLLAMESHRLSTQSATNAEIDELERRVKRTEISFRTWLAKVNRKPGQRGYPLLVRRSAAKDVLVQQGFSHRDAETAVQALVDDDMLPDPPRSVPGLGATHGDPLAGSAIEPTADRYRSHPGNLTRDDVRSSLREIESRVPETIREIESHLPETMAEVERQMMRDASKYGLSPSDVRAQLRELESGTRQEIRNMEDDVIRELRGLEADVWRELNR